jgi:hypothetical protein
MSPEQLCCIYVAYASWQSLPENRIAYFPRLREWMVQYPGKKVQYQLGTCPLAEIAMSAGKGAVGHVRPDTICHSWGHPIGQQFRFKQGQR